MIVIRQPIGSRVCGQCCIAMACGITLAEATALVGHDNGTDTKTLVKALRKRGFLVRNRLTPIRSATLPARAVIKVRQCKFGKRWAPHFGGWCRGWHWVLWWDGQLYDPDSTEHHIINGCFSSYLDLTKKRLDTHQNGC